MARARTRTSFRCIECATVAPRWVGRCNGCGGWDTLVEEIEPSDGVGPELAAGTPAGSADPITEVDATDSSARPTGVGELDRVLGGGLVPGSVSLLGGEPGIGKSTLLLQAAAAMARAGSRTLLVTAEESRPQVRLRAERLGALAPELFLAAETTLPGALAHVGTVGPRVCVVDSVQALHDPALDSAPGGVAQVRHCAHRLVQAAKGHEMAVVLVGHVTKEGTLAGPRVLEHVVDTVLSFEGERHHALRLLRAVKHRFGATHELGLFEMAEAGLVGVPDAGALFLSDRRAGVAGSAVVPTMEGRRPLLVELQALVARSDLPVARRSSQGLDPGRLALLLAVLQRRVQVSLGGCDVYASAVGGVRVSEPGADLALALALVSAHRDVPLAPDLVACGEVGLGGELRQVAQTPRRLAEAARLGFRRALVPRSSPEQPSGISALPASTLAEDIEVAGLAAGSVVGGR